METVLRHPGYGRFPTPSRLARATPPATSSAGMRLAVPLMLSAELVGGTRRSR